jgi:hypothetical protein
MTECRTYDNVTQKVFDCVKASSAREHGTVYEPANGLKGTATTKTIVGTVELSFELDLQTQTIKYCILKKPGLVPAKDVFNGIADSITKCQTTST